MPIQLPAPRLPRAASPWVLPLAGTLALAVCAAALAGGGEQVMEALSKDSTGLAAAANGDPRGDSWTVIQQSLEQFLHPLFFIRLLLSLLLGVGCSWIVAWHPRRATRLDPLTDLEERKALILLGMVGTIIAELSGVNQTMAFVIFGIGALLRFRTVLDNPKLTGKAITVVIIGLACGLGQWALAAFVTGFSWVLIYWLDSHISCRVRIRLDKHADITRSFQEAKLVLASHRCRTKSATMREGERQLVFLLHTPTDLDPADLVASLVSGMTDGRLADINVRTE